MTRYAQGAKSRGSQHWLQVIANERTSLFERAAVEAGICGVRWLAPLQSDDYAEYRDQAFLDLLGLELPRRPLRSFWPARGPAWDGLALSSSGSAILVEAKANIAELASPASRAGSASARLIRRSLDEAKPAFGSPLAADWTGTYYQYANRLAHLYLLRACNGIEAYLVFLYFTGAVEVQGPSNRGEWAAPILAAHQALQMGQGPLTPFVIELFVDVARLAAA